MCLYVLTLFSNVNFFVVCDPLGFFIASGETWDNSLFLITSFEVLSFSSR